MPVFDAERLELDSSVDEIYAEAFEFEPYARAEDRTDSDAPDPSRLSATVMGVFFDPPARPTTANAYDVREHNRPGVQAGTPRIEISQSEIAAQTAALGSQFIVSDTDRFRRVASGTVYRVASSFVTATGFLKVNVNKVG